MKITKFGHCCLLIEVKGVRILTDPGMFTKEQNEIKDIDVVLITHEHEDHLHAASMKEVMKNNPSANVITNASVGKILKDMGVTFDVVADGDSTTVKEVLFEGFGKDHKEIYKEIGLVENTGYFIDGTLFYPGDAFFVPGKSVKVLALPVAGPWLNIGEAVRYAIEVKPKVAFPVHDGMIKEGGEGFAYDILYKVLAGENIQFEKLKNGEFREF